MAALVAAIHDLDAGRSARPVIMDGRHKGGHDGFGLV